MNLFALSGLLTGITSLSIGLFVFFKQRRTHLNKIWIIFSITVAIWGFGCFKMASTSNKAEAFLWYRLAHIGVTLIPIFIYHFVYVFLNLKKKKLLQVVYLIGSIFFIANLKDLFASYFFPDSARYLIIAHMKWIFNSFYMDTPPGPIYPLFVTYFFIVVGMIYYDLSRAVIKSSGIRRAQVKYFFLANIIGFIGGGTSFLPVFGINFYPIGNFATAIWPIIITYTIFKYRLMDIEVALGKTATFITTQCIIVGIPVIIIIFGKYPLQLILGERWWVIPLVAFGLLAEANFLINSFIHRKMYSKQIHRLQETQEALEISGRGMIEIDDVYRLARIIPRYLTLFYYARLRIKINHATIFLLDSAKHQYRLISSAGEERHMRGKALLLNSPLCNWFTYKRKQILRQRVAKPGDIDVLRIDDIDHWMQNQKLLSLESNMSTFLKELKRDMESLQAIICVPSFFKGNLLGFLLLGNKSQGMYTEEELELFSRLATNAAAAFRSAQLSELIRTFEAEKAEVMRLKGIGEMLNSVRHEIGNLMGKIGGNIQMMVSAYNKNNKEYFMDLNKKSVRDTMQAKVIWGYVDEYRKKSRSKNALSCNLRDMITSGISHSNGIIEEWNIRIYHAIDPRISIIGKETLPDIFKHLVINSCYGMETTGGEISFSASIIEESNMVEIIQSDTGYDLTEGIRKHETMGGELFAEQGKLGGINLFLVKSIVRDHNGIVNVESNEGKGTKFIIRLPLDFTKVLL